MLSVWHAHLRELPRISQHKRRPLVFAKMSTNFPIQTDLIDLARGKISDKQDDATQAVHALIRVAYFGGNISLHHHET